jgi:hypothetical protein
MQENRIYLDRFYYIFGYHKLVKIVSYYKTKKTIMLSVFCDSWLELQKETQKQLIEVDVWEKTPKVLLRENELRMYDFLECNSVLGYKVTEIPYNCKYFKEANNNGKKTT